ncbi:MAG: hypothetical protein GXO80_02210 [Chlorobi bacterium]|nr:hypothetical protein [Chlorobiota bacterium]
MKYKKITSSELTSLIIQMDPVIFEKIEFTENINIHNKEIKFINCLFLENVELSTDIYNKFLIKNCVFEKNLKFNKTVNEINLKNNIIKGTFFISEATRNIFIEKGDYNEITVQSSKAAYYVGDVFKISNAKCDFIKFEGEDLNRVLEFSNSEIETIIIETNNVSHENIIIKDESKINYLFFNNNHINIPYVFDFDNAYVFHFAFQSCSFSHRLEFAKGKIEELNFHKVTFKEQTIISEHFIVGIFNFNSVKSEYEISIAYHSKIGTLNIDNCDLNLSFWIFDEEKRDLENKISIKIGGTFNGNIHIENIPANIHLSCINSGTIFLNNIYSKLIIFQYFFNYNKLILNNFKRDKDYNALIISESNLNETEFVNFDFDKFDEVVISRSNVSNMLLTNTIFPKKIQIESKNPQLGYIVDFEDNIGKNVYFRDSYRQLKNVMEKHKNKHVALIYKSKEMYYQKKELKFGFNWFTLLLNQISNNHGISWQRGVFFTILLSVIFFILYNFTLADPFFYWDNIVINKQNVFDKFIEFLASFPKLSIVKQETTLSTIVIILSKIFISYGIYQTIVAFRKYGK